MRFCVFLTFIAVLGACASTPPSRQGVSTSIASLRLCDGVKISNAPATDRTGRIINYDSTANIGGSSLLRAPVNACVSSGYGPRNGGASSFHHGVDLYTRSPSAVYAGGDGVIASIGTLNGYGKTILIRHGRGVETRYAHLSEIAPGLRKGAHVARGERIAMTGRTGNATAVHLHYEIIVDGRRHNPLTVGR
ncbi:M23 family metallopeptidase [Hyphococcus sp.]|uniref:M23 family metallopeptidase n=1 Tax=Hyphococcus sp. TaxID=2038636 RepID=UPI0037527489